MPIRIAIQLAALGLLQLVTLHSQTRPASLSWWVEGPMVKVHPGDLPPEHPARRAEIFAARNEFEPFQVVLRTDADGLSGLDVDVSDLRSADGSGIPKANIGTYLEQFVRVTQPSMASGTAGLWPDPLLPRIDRYAHERRNAFPFRLTKSQDQPLWIEVFVPVAAAPGRYSGVVRILRDGAVTVSFPVSLTVWPFTLPSTASLRSSFGLNGTTILKQHKGSYTSDADLYTLTRAYQLAALEHRISIHSGSNVPPRYTGAGEELKINWHAYDDEVGPFLNGTAIPKNDPLYGARATSTDLRSPAQFENAADQAPYLAGWVKHFRKMSWNDLLFLYLWDEPAPQVYPQVEAKGILALRSDSSIRTLVTVPFTSRLEDAVRIWVPLVNCLEPRPGSDDFCHETPDLSAYDAERARGKHLWIYQSCASHGCGGKGGAYFEGWPSYMIDASGAANRVMQWVAWKYKAEGELYFSMNEAYAYPGDPWTDFFLSGGNGDGTLFYPGRPARIGGHTDIPIESLRLKLIREGMEDFEYLALVAAARGMKAADEFAARIVQKPWSSENRPEKFAQIRQEMAHVLSGDAQAVGSGTP